MLKLLTEVACLVLVVVGVGMLSVPVALIVAGGVGVVAVEVRG